MIVRYYYGVLSIVLAILMFRGKALGASVSAAKLAFDPQRGSLLAPLLHPRVAGTLGSAKAREHIISELQRVNWSVSTLKFTADTPIGAVEMHNILANRQAANNVTDNLASPKNNATQKLTLAAHYDSKRTPEGFIGAIDSAFPCALLLYLAGITKPKKYDFDLIFFDGEEAFEKWTDEDSIYGAKALAAHQENTNTLPETLVLLDLLGNEARFPIPSWFSQTKALHKQLENINPRLVGGRDLHEYAGMVQDDHLPYFARGVPVLHLIPHTFPDVWHTAEDNASALDLDTMEDWANLFEAWLFEDS